ncbi:MAG: hypothetical protein GY869_21970 [Planctomycetes bacterium]|nr:hypothetical protein [Planctomycetota bacterium]
MKNTLKLSGVLVLIMTVIGCQNTELLRYQEENQALKEQLAVSEKKNEETITIYNEMIKLIQSETNNPMLAQSEKKAIEGLTQAQQKETIPVLRQRLDQTSQMLLLAQQKNIKLQEKIKELEKKIKK